jgi:hypothetical protein
MNEIRLSEAFRPRVRRVRFDEGMATVALVFADGSRVVGRLQGDGLDFWTAGSIPPSEVVEIDEFVG